MTRDVCMAVVRARVMSMRELCRAEVAATRAREWWLAEQYRWAIAHRCIEGGDERVS